MRCKKFGGGVSGLALALLLVALFAAALHAEDRDPRVEWLAQHAVRIRSIDPADDDFKDLEPIGATLKDVRIVLLGEQSRGDGSTFLAKTRLVRYLHEQMGFDVLVFESGLYDCAKAWDLLVEGKTPDAVSRGVFRIWSVSREVQPLIEYLDAAAKSARPLELAGADCQLTGSASADFLPSDLAAYLTRIDPKLAQGDEWDRVVRVIRHLHDGSWELRTMPPPPANERAAFVRTIEQWRSRIAAHDSSPATRAWSGAFWRQFLASLRVFAEETWRTAVTDQTLDPVAFAMRDKQMGKNLVWLAKERYPGKKIIVWAATFHNARAVGTIDTGDATHRRLYAATSPMGEVAWKELGAQLYSLGFTSQAGESATAFAQNANALLTPTRDSLEDLFGRTGLELAFLDFRRRAPGGDWLRKPLIARPFGHAEMRADWTRILDGMLFIRVMERSHRVRVPLTPAAAGSPAGRTSRGARRCGRRGGR